MLVRPQLRAGSLGTLGLGVSDPLFLLETGDRFLLETSDRLILEGAYVADTKGSSLTVQTDVTRADRIVIVRDPSGTPETQTAAFKDIFPRYTTAEMNVITGEPGEMIWNETVKEHFRWEENASDWVSTTTGLPEA